jgi:hypothetical protein
MGAREREWIMVRLKRETHKALVALGEQWQEMARNGDLACPYDPDGERPSMDKIVGELLARLFEHRARGRRNSRRSNRFQADSKGPGEEDG